MRQISPYLLLCLCLWQLTAIAQQQPSPKIGHVAYQFDFELDPFLCRFGYDSLAGKGLVAGVNPIPCRLNFFAPEGGASVDFQQFAAEDGKLIGAVSGWRDSLLLFFKRQTENKGFMLLGQEGGRRYLEHGHIFNYYAPEPERETPEVLCFEDIQVRGEYLYFRVLPYMMLHQYDGIRKSVLARMHLPTREIERLPIYHPEVFYLKEVFPFYDVGFIESNENELVYGFRGHPLVYRLDLASGELDSLETLSPSLPLRSPPDADPEAYSLLVDATVGSYGRILWDPWRQVYYRLIHPPIAQTREAAQKLEYADLPTSVLIYDPNWNLIREEALGTDYTDWQAFVAPQGLMLHKRSDVDLETHRLGFDVFNWQNW